MEKIKFVNLCNCMTKLIIIDFVHEYKDGFILSNFASEVTEGQLCLVSDEIVDEGDYDQDGNLIYEGNFDETLATFCPREGDGEEYDSEGNIIYNGEWQKDQRNGNGDYYKDGYLFFTGYWKNNVPMGEGCLLNEEGRKIFVEAFETRMETAFLHSKLKRKVTYRTAIKLDCYKLIKNILEDKEFIPFSLKELPV